MQKQSHLLTRWLVAYGACIPNHPGKWWLHEQLRTRLRVRPEGDRVVERAGIHWLLDPADYVQADLFWFGSKDPWEFSHLSRLLSPECVLLDVGSNFGYYSIALVSKLGAGCRAFAFEPNPPTFDRLCRNIELNGLGEFVRARCVAMSDVEGEALLFQAPDNSGASRIADVGTGIPTRLETLDRFCNSEMLARVDAIKIDVEGFEERVLVGATETLSRFRPIIAIELNPPALQRQGSSPAAVVERLRLAGYEVYEVRRQQLAPLTHLPDGENYINAICLPRERSPSV